MMWSIQRTWEVIPSGKKTSLQKSIAKFIDSCLDENISKQHWFKFKMDNSRLLAEDDRIELYVRHKHFFGQSFALEKFGSSFDAGHNLGTKRRLGPGGVGLLRCCGFDSGQCGSVDSSRVMPGTSFKRVRRQESLPQGPRLAAGCDGTSRWVAPPGRQLAGRPDVEPRR